MLVVAKTGGTSASYGKYSCDYEASGLKTKIHNFSRVNTDRSTTGLQWDGMKIIEVSHWKSVSYI